MEIYAFSISFILVMRQTIILNFQSSFYFFQIEHLLCFCIVDLTKHVVKDYEGIENLMDEGNTNR